MNRYEPKHARCYCAVTAAAVATVAGTGYALMESEKQKKAVETAQNTGTSAQKYGTKFEPVEYRDTVDSDENYINQISRDSSKVMLGSLDDVFEASSRINTRTGNMRRRVSPDFYGTIKQEGQNIAEMERGVIPTSVSDSIQKKVAELVGGAVDPSAPGGGFAISSTASDTAKRLGLTSMDLMKTGMQMGPTWRSNVDSFLYTPEDAISGLLFPSIKTAENTAQLQMLRDQNQYISANNMARAEAMPDPGVTGARNDALTFGALNAQIGQSQAEAMSGLISGVGSLYSSVKPKAKTGTTGTMGTSGTYRSGVSSHIG